MLGLIAPRRCMGCDEIIEDQDPVYCAADFDLLQKERESEGRAARALYEVTTANYERAKAALTALMEAARTSLPSLRSAHTVSCSLYEYKNGVLPRKATGTCDCGTAARAAEIQAVIDAAPSLPLSPSAQQAAERLAGV